MALIQKILDKYQAGLRVVAVQLQDVNPPNQVRDAFIDVASAREDKNRIINEAQGYRNAIIPETRGKVSEILNQSEAYRAEKIRRATGDADRFKQILDEYLKAKDVTRKRLYLETMEEIPARNQEGHSRSTKERGPPHSSTGRREREPADRNQGKSVNAEKNRFFS